MKVWNLLADLESVFHVSEESYTTRMWCAASWTGYKEHN